MGMKIDLKALNERIASTTTVLMGSMGCVYLFAIWSILPVLFPKLQSFVFYVSGGVIQLVALPLIMVGSAVLSKKSEERAIEDHETLMAEMAELKAMHDELHIVLANITVKVEPKNE